MQADPLHLDGPTRRRVWQAVGDAIENYYRDVRHLDASPAVDAAEVLDAIAGFDFDRPQSPETAISLAVQAMRRLESHVMHPRHFGLFDPAPTAMGVVAEALVAAFNPCLASWAGSPFGVETERHLALTFGQLFGYAPSHADGIMTTGGSEANLTAVLLALRARFPGYQEGLLRAASGQPCIYATRHAHPSALKAAVITGLGTPAVRQVPVDPGYRMDAAVLGGMIEEDLAAGKIPLAIIGTFGTTDAGVIDPISGIADTAERYGLWFHVDAAWGGAAILLPELKDAFRGIDRADSIAFDPHKWLSVPMGCGLLLTRHPGLLDQTFSIGAGFLTGIQEPGVDPHTRSVRWSRDFAGLKLLLSLAVAGWQGYQDALRGQIRLASRLRDGLAADGWQVVNDTPLPVVCFAGRDDAERVADMVNHSGQARIFPVQLGDRVVLRACVTNYGTREEDIDQLIKLLAQVRADVRPGAPSAQPK